MTDAEKAAAEKAALEKKAGEKKPSKPAPVMPKYKAGREITMPNGNSHYAPGQVFPNNEAVESLSNFEELLDDKTIVLVGDPLPGPIDHRAKAEAQERAALARHQPKKE